MRIKACLPTSSWHSCWLDTVNLFFKINKTERPECGYYADLMDDAVHISFIAKCSRSRQLDKKGDQPKPTYVMSSVDNWTAICGYDQDVLSRNKVEESEREFQQKGGRRIVVLWKNRITSLEIL